MADSCGQHVLSAILIVCILNGSGVNFVKSVVIDIFCHAGNVWVPFEKVFLQNVTICDIPHCPSNCFCTLGDRQLLTTCFDGTEIAVGITYPENITTLYLGNISLNNVNMFAFKDIVGELTELYLNDNSLRELQPGVFDGLSTLEYLHLFCNHLIELRLGLFDGLSSLVYVDLECNMLVNLHPDIFRGLTQLRELDLEKNKLKEIHRGTFRNLTNLEDLQLDNNMLFGLEAYVFEGLKSIEVIDLDNNQLERISTSAFRGLNTLVELDLDKNQISDLPSDVFHGLTNLEELELDHNKLTNIPKGLLEGLLMIEGLTLSFNEITDVDSAMFSRMSNLKELHLSFNNLFDLHPNLFSYSHKLEVLLIDHNNLKNLNPNIFRNLSNLKTLSLARTNLFYLQDIIFEDLHELMFLNISRNNLNRVQFGLFAPLAKLVTLDLTQNPLDLVITKSFTDVSKHTTVYVDEYATCCFIETARCSFEFPRSSFISCKRLLPYSILRVTIWILSIATIVGNTLVLFKRYRHKSSRGYVQLLLIANLSMSDLLMGVYLAILLSVDLWYHDYFPSHSESWRHSTLCRIAGALSLLSSEASVFFITLISIDRFVSIKYPFSVVRLNKKSTKVAVTTLWLVSLLISIATILIPIFSPDLYEASEICVGLPISRINKYITKTKSFNLNTSSIETGFDIGHVVEAELIGSKPAMFLSVAIFTVLNLLCFLTVAVCYVMIFVTAKQASRVGGTTNTNREIRRAFKMAAIVLSDFCCWMVIVVMSILVQSKAIIIDPEAYAWIATFVLPINACMNPFLYTLSTLISNRFQRKIDPSSVTDGNSQLQRSNMPT